MTKLNPPTDLFESVYDLCVAQVGSASARTELSHAKTALSQLAALYSVRATNGSLHLLGQNSSVVGVSCLDDVKKLYAGQLRRKGTPARAVYNRLMAGAPLKRCPICQVGTVFTLDHYLPIAEFNQFSVLPLNLVPACRDCNTNKLSDIATAAGEQALHSYFDDVDQMAWLHAAFVDLNPPIMKFSVDADEPLASRLRAHLRVFQLQVIYESNASVELNRAKAKVQRVYRRSGRAGVFEYLQEEAEVHTDTGRNTWQAAMYRGLVGSTQFCDWAGT